MTNFDDLGLAKPVQKAITTLGYEKPSPIQAEMIPVLLEGNDAIGIAQTGTGKTAAFMLPLLTFLSRMNGRPQKGKCDVLIMTPTRELASQILDNARIYGQHMKFASALIVGGARYEGQLRALAKGVNLIVATPGRLIDHIETGAADLSNVSYVVLDEADQMLDMGFVPAIREIMSTVPDERQTILTSATMPKPIEKLANELLRSPKRIAVSRESEPAKNVKQEIIFVDKPQKPAQLLSVLEDQDWSKVIIFTRTKRGADKVQVQLIKSGIIAQSLHGDKSFGQRRHIMDEFKSGEVPVLVATDLAGRGLDISDVSLVVNYDMPNIAESYVHRIGRTGRAGRKGIAVSLVDRSEKSYLRDIEKLMGVSLGGERGTAKASGKPAGKPSGKSFDKSADGEGGKRRFGEKSRDGGSQWKGKPDRKKKSETGGKFKKADKFAKSGDKPRGDKSRSDKPRNDKSRNDWSNDGARGPARKPARKPKEQREFGSRDFDDKRQSDDRRQFDDRPRKPKQNNGKPGFFEREEGKSDKPTGKKSFSKSRKPSGKASAKPPRKGTAKPSRAERKAKTAGGPSGDNKTGNNRMKRSANFKGRKASA